MDVSYHKMDVAQRREILVEALLHLRFVFELYEWQVQQGRLWLHVRHLQMVLRNEMARTR